MQFRIGREKHPVYVFRKTLPFVKQAQIIRNATQNHISLGNREPVPPKTIGLQIFLGLSKSEWMEMQFVCYPVVKPTVVVYYVIHHPSRGRTADDQFNVFLTVRPAVPKQVQSLYQTRPRCVQARQFINEYDSVPFCQRWSQHSLQSLEGLYPGLWPHATITCLLKGQKKTGHLILPVTLQHTSHVESQSILENLRYQICFSDTTTAINRNEFRSWAFYVLFE